MSLNTVQLSHNSVANTGKLFTCSLYNHYLLLKCRVMNICHKFIVRCVHTVVEPRAIVGLKRAGCCVTSPLLCPAFQCYFCSSAILQGPGFHHLSLSYFDIYYGFQRLFAVETFCYFLIVLQIKHICRQKLCFLEEETNYIYMILLRAQRLRFESR
jgi:hypothetical protein